MKKLFVIGVITVLFLGNIYQFGVNLYHKEFYQARTTEYGIARSLNTLQSLYEIFERDSNTDPLRQVFILKLAEQSALDKWKEKYDLEPQKATKLIAERIKKHKLKTEKQSK